jgi:Secretion system C-terminal sorting domain
MKIITVTLFLIAVAKIPYAQQIAGARNVQLVTQPATQLVLKGGISFTGTSLLTHKGTVTLLSNPVSGTANWLDSTAGVMNISSNGLVAFKGGSSLQQVYGPTRFDSLTIQNTGIHLLQSNEVRQCLDLRQGLIYFLNTSDSIYISNPSLTAIVYNTDSLATGSWVHGKLSRRMNSTAGAYFFPIGKILSGDSLYAPVRIEKQNTGAATFSAQYIPAVPFDRNNKNPVIDHISSQEYWEITSHNFASSGDDDVVLSISWRDYSVVSPTAIIRDSLLVAHYYFDGAFFQWQPEFNPALPNNINGNVSFGYIKTNKIVGDFSMPHLRFTIGTRSPQNLLPLTLLDWNAVKQNRTAVCSWTVSDDRAVEVYQVQRSADGTLFNTIGTVSSRRQPGNSNYIITDHAPLPGRNYYRLKAMGNGLTNYSAARMLNFDNTQDWVIYPNPATELLNVKLPVSSRSAKLRITDAGGKLVAERNVTGLLVQINISALASGIYYMELLQPGTREVKSFIKN